MAGTRSGHGKASSMSKRSHPIRLAVAAVAVVVGLLAVVGPAATPAGAVTPACPAAAGNPRFVRFIYLQILGRCPEAGALAFWTGKLDGGMSRWAFAEAVDMSTENVVKNNVVAIYVGYRGRQPTAAEREAGIKEIRTNHQDARIIAGLLASEEVYDGTPGSTPQEKDQAWLADAYGHILDRAPDAAGAAHFMTVLGAGGSTVATRYKVAMAFEYSRENDRSWISGVYFTAVARPPDAAGTAYWLDWLQGRGQQRTFQLWTHVLASNEGYAYAQTQPTPDAH